MLAALSNLSKLTPRFGIRTLLLLALFSAVLLAFVFPNLKRAYRQKVAVDWVRNFGREPGYEQFTRGHDKSDMWESTLAKDVVFDVTFVHLDNKNVNDIHCLADLPGLKHLEIAAANVSDLSPLKEIAQLEHLSISQNPISDLTPIRGLRNLKRLYAYDTDIATVECLRDLILLQGVALNDTPVQDISPLGGLTDLKFLDISGTNVSSIEPLFKLERLETLNLGGTSVPDTEIERFIQLNPSCKISR